MRGTEVGADMGSVAVVLSQRGWTVHSIQQSGSLETPAQPVVAHTEVQTGERVSTERLESPEDITGQRNVVMTDIVGPLVGKVPLPQLHFFFKQASVMFKAGINPVESFHTLAGQTQSPKLRTVILELEEHARAGRPMSFGLQRYPEVFSPVCLSLIRVGERSGNLDEALAFNSQYIEREMFLRNIVKKATIYPKIVVVSSVIILSGANSVIHAVAPGSSVSTSSPLQKLAVWAILAPLLIGIFVFLRVGLQNPRIRYNWDQINSRIPYIGKTLRQLAMAKFGRAMGALYRGGVPIQEAMKLAADSCGNEYMRAQMYPAFRAMESGAGVTESLRATGAFNPIVLDMTSTGERTGNLDEMLEKMAEFYEAEAEVRSIQVAYIIGAGALLLVGIYVGYVYVTNMSNIVGGGLQDAMNEGK